MMRMTEREAGYLHALADVESEVRKTVQDPSTSTEGRLELLGVLSLLSELVAVKVQSHRASETISPQGFWEREF
jgi:hypothetical protein